VSPRTFTGLAPPSREFTAGHRAGCTNPHRTLSFVVRGATSWDDGGAAHYCLTCGGCWLGRIIPLTADELDRVSRRFATPHSTCPDGCGQSGMPGVRAPCYPDGDTLHEFVERCDACQLYDGDQSAAEALVAAFNATNPPLPLVVRRRYDSVALDAWRPFVTRVGAPDDVDLFACGASWCGCHPHAEYPIPEPALS
jgi:hypothetical protein